MHGVCSYKTLGNVITCESKVGVNVALMGVHVSEHPMPNPKGVREVKGVYLISADQLQTVFQVPNDPTHATC
jgi:hypothetical protein